MNKSSFSLLKEKIIKTDAVITLVAEKSNKIKGLEEKLKMLYKRYMDKSKENEALHHQAKMCELEHRPLKEQIKELQNQCSESESKYDSLLNASEIKYQSLGVELEVCKGKYEKLLKKNKQLQKSTVTASITKHMRRHSETVQCKDKMQILIEKVEILKSQVVRLSEKSDRDDDELNYFRTNYGKILPCEDVVPKSVHVKKLDGLKSQQLDELEQMRCKYAGETSELKEKIDALEVAQRSLRIKLKALKLQNKSMGDRLASLSVEKDCMENLLQVNASLQLTENSYESKDNSLETKIDECYDEEGLRWSETDDDDDDVSMERVDDIFNEMIDVPSFLSPFHTSCSTEDIDSLPDLENEGGNEEIIETNEEEDTRIEDSCHNDCREIDTKKDVNSNIEDEIMNNVGTEIERNEASIVLNENSEVGPSNEDKQIDRNRDTAISKELDSLPDFENEGGNEEIIKSNEDEDTRIEDTSHNDFREIDTKEDVNSNIEDEIMSNVASEIVRNDASIVLNENSEVGPSNEDKQIDSNHQDTVTSKELDSLPDFENEGGNEEIIKSNEEEDTRIEDSCHNDCREIATKKDVNSNIEDEIMNNVGTEIERNEASIVLNENSEVGPSNEHKQIDRNHRDTAISKELDSLPDFENEGGNEEIIKSNEDEDTRIEDSSHNDCREIDTKEDVNSNIEDEIMNNVGTEIERNEASIVLNENSEVGPSNEDKQIDRNHQGTVISKELGESSNEENIKDNEDITLNNDGDVKSHVEISSENREMIKRKKEENVIKNNDVIGIGIPEITITPPTPPTAQLSEFCFITPSSGEAKTGTVTLKEDPISIANKESESNVVNDIRDLNAQSKENKSVLDCNFNGFACTSIQTTRLQDDRSETRRIKIANAAIKRKKARLWNNKVKALKKEIFISVVKYVNRKFSMGQKRPYGINLLEIQKSKFNCIYRSRKLRMMRWKLLRESNTYNTDTESDICRRTRLRTRTKKARRRTKPNKIDSKMVDNSVQLADLSDDASRLIADTEQEYKEITRNYNELEFFFNALNDSCGTQMVKITEPDRETQLEINKNDEMNEMQNNDTFEYEISSVDSGYFKSDSETFEVHKDRNVKTYGVRKKCHRASTAKKNSSELGQLKEDQINISSVENHVPLINDLCVTTDTLHSIPDTIINNKIDQEPNFDSHSISVDMTQQLFGSDCSLMSIEDLNVTEVLNTCGVDLDNIEMFPADFISSQESFTTNDSNTKNKTSEESHIDINCTNVAEKPDATSDNKKKCRKRKRHEKGAFGDLTDKDELQENTKPKLVKPLENNDVRVNQNCHKETVNSMERTKEILQRRWDSVLRNKTLPRKTSTSALEKLLEGKNELKNSCITKNPKSVKRQIEVDSPQAKVTPLNKPIVAKSCESLPSAETSLAALEKRLKEDDGSSCAGTVKSTIRVIRAASFNTFARKLKRPNCFKRIANSPKSPEPQVAIEPTAPIIIPLNAQRPMSPVTASTLFKRMLCFPNKLAILEEVAERCKFQDKDHLSRLIISEVSEDTLHNPDTNYTPPAPVLTETQRVLLGLMHKLDSTHLPGLLNSFMCQVEKHLLFNTKINCLQPVTRLYLAVCKFRKDIDRMRRTICDALYFMDELVIPFLFTVLSTWIELLPLEINSNDEPIIKVLIQVVNSKTCNRPGYNLMNLRRLLQGYYGYPKERGNPDEIFQDVFKQYLRTPTKSIEYSIIIMCKNHPTNWVFQQIDSHLKPAVMNEQDVHVRAAVLRIIGYILKQFNPKKDAIVLKNIEIWLKVICDDPLLLEIKEYVQKTIEMIPNS